MSQRNALVLLFTRWVSSRCRSTIVTAILCGASFSACTNYYDPPEGWEGPYTAPEVLNKALEKANSRIDPMEGAEDLTVTATIKLQHDIDPIECGYVVKWKRPNQFSIEVVDGPLQGDKIVCDGSAIVALKGGVVVKRDVPKQDTAITRFMNRLFVLHYFRSGPGSEPEMRENTKGPKAEPWIRIGKQDDSGFVNYLMLDAKSLEPKMLQWLAPYEDGSQHTIDTWFADIREDSRAGRIPHTWRSYEGNKLREELRIKGLSWNRGLSAAEFQVPQS